MRRRMKRVRGAKAHRLNCPYGASVIPNAGRVVQRLQKGAAPDRAE